MDKELTDEELERIDLLHNETYDFINRILPGGREIGWDLNLIDNVIEAVWNGIKDWNVCTEMEFYPYREN